MTKEQEESIEYLNESILIYKNTIPKISQAIETVLNMLKEKDKEIEKKDRQINFMANFINDNIPYTKDTKELENEEGIRTANFTTKYFERKSEGWNMWQV